MRLILLIISLLFAQCTFAQVKEDVVYLNDGTELRGEIIYQDSAQVKIKIYGGSVFMVQRSEIDKIVREPKEQEATDTSPFFIKQRGFWMQMNIGLPFGRNISNRFTAGFSWNAIAGYQRFPALRMGVGTGLDFYHSEAIFMPIFCRVAGDVFQTPVTPIYFVDIGYGRNLQDDMGQRVYHGGWLVNIGTGVRINTKTRSNFNLVVSYKLQNAGLTVYDRFGVSYEERYQFNRVETKFVWGF